MKFPYLPLDSLNKEIRLLKVLPRSQCAEHKLIPSCQIFHAFLVDKPQYKTLSYVWGDTDIKRVIFVEGLPVLVTKNLYDAIMALRLSDESLVIWIDSVCIDQRNNEEKSWQVELMADIYRQAKQVSAWLGPRDSDSDIVMDYLDSFGRKAEACGITHAEGPHTEMWQNLMFQNPSIYARNQELESLFHSICGWRGKNNLLPIDGMKRFFTRPWWGRIWVLQEITLPENADLVCGTKRISRSRCRAAINAYQAFRTILTRNFMNRRPLTRYHLEIIKELFHHRPNIMLCSRNVYRDNRFPLAALLRLTCVGSHNHHRHGPHHLESTDPRDKIFALLSLASDRDDLKRRGVFPDYTKSYTEIYTLAMVAMLQQGHMTLLSLCQASKSQDNLPSWVPDWSRSVNHMLQDVRNDHITIYPAFRASGPAPTNLKMPLTRGSGGLVKAISVIGNMYDEVHRVGSFPRRASSQEVPLSDTFSWPSEWLVETLRLTYYSKDIFLDFEDRLQAAARTSIGEVGWDQNARLTRVGDGRFSEAVVLLKIGINYIREYYIKLEAQKFLEERMKTESSKAKVNTHVGLSTGTMRLSSEIMGKSLGRLPFISKKGHLILGSENIKQGDVISLIRGVQVPFILRYQGGGAYQLVSEAYVDGIMDGEAAERAIFSDIKLI
ncbi:heterokaryon incompatibility protein-domain-containing protein [Xylogone sp. PMI_703]|nr:heterokaryon incompatibility protein-domain-containing protein [Xylogone sp. PMI_703]